MNGVQGVAHPPLSRRLDDLLFGPEAPARLVVVQGLLMVVFGIRTAFFPFPSLTPQPPALFRPVAMLSFLDRMPSQFVINALQGFVIVAVVTWFAAAGGGRWRGRLRQVAFAVAWFCFLVLAGLEGSRGKIYHIELLLVWGSLPMVFAPGDASFADRAPSRRYGWPIRTSIAVIAVIYCLTGIQKLRSSGFEWVFSDNLKWALAWGRVKGQPPPLRPVGVFIADHLWLSQLSAAFILTFEVSFPIVVFWRKIRPVYVAAAWAFHLGTLMLLGLDYTVWLCVTTILLIDWPRLIDRACGTGTAPAELVALDGAAVP